MLRRGDIGSGKRRERPIEEVQAGDKVLAENIETGEIAYKEVARTFINQSEAIIHITGMI